MKRSTIFLWLLLFAACNSESRRTGQGQEKAVEKEMTADEEKGLDLVARTGCLTCHKVDQQFNGPAFTAIAARYPKNGQVMDSLSQKIVKGGMGNWGTIPMQPNPNLKPEDVRLMLEYIFSLKQQ